MTLIILDSIQRANTYTAFEHTPFTIIDENERNSTTKTPEWQHGVIFDERLNVIPTTTTTTKNTLTRIQHCMSFAQEFVQRTKKMTNWFSFHFFENLNKLFFSSWLSFWAWRHAKLQSLLQNWETIGGMNAHKNLYIRWHEHTLTNKKKNDCNFHGAHCQREFMVVIHHNAVFFVGVLFAENLIMFCLTYPSLNVRFCVAYFHLCLSALSIAVLTFFSFTVVSRSK